MVKTTLKLIPRPDIARIFADTGLSNTAISRRADVSISSVRKVYTGNPLSLHVFTKIAKALGKPVDYFGEVM